jgi:ADP-ribose pyrophosphatase YjhB (NUDIX family)
MKYATATPFIACHVIVKQSSKLAFLLRNNTAWMNGFYTVPSGKVERGEAFLDATVREVKEEIGVEVRKEDLQLVHTMHRNGYDDNTEWLDLYFEATKYGGTAINAEPESHSELIWLEPKNLPDNVVPCVRFALEQIEAGKAYSEYGWDKRSG